MILITGPSGSGKSTALNNLKSDKSFKDFISSVSNYIKLIDLDDYGYRYKREDVNSWTIDIDAIRSISSKVTVIAFGVAQNIDEIISISSKVLILKPSIDAAYISNLRLREIERSVNGNWKAVFEEKLKVLQNIDDWYKQMNISGDTYSVSNLLSILSSGDHDADKREKL